jgi:hypothetical protein
MVVEPSGQHRRWNLRDPEGHHRRTNFADAALATYTVEPLSDDQMMRPNVLSLDRQDASSICSSWWEYVLPIVSEALTSDIVAVAQPEWDGQVYSAVQKRCSSNRVQDQQVAIGIAVKSGTSGRPVWILMVDWWASGVAETQGSSLDLALY